MESPLCKHMTLPFTINPIIAFNLIIVLPLAEIRTPNFWGELDELIL